MQQRHDQVRADATERFSASIHGARDVAGNPGHGDVDEVAAAYLPVRLGPGDTGGIDGVTGVGRMDQRLPIRRFARQPKVPGHVAAGTDREMGHGEIGRGREFGGWKDTDVVEQRGEQPANDFAERPVSADGDNAVVSLAEGLAGKLFGMAAAVGLLDAPRERPGSALRRIIRAAARLEAPPKALGAAVPGSGIDNEEPSCHRESLPNLPPPRRSCDPLRQETTIEPR
jgi:hypothetical protein